ncbi:MAG: hypothetical protein EXR77_09785 [Myxococcales bacterium]|nr:hypothetical protein [Myxococcales bacterium]
MQAVATNALAGPTKMPNISTLTMAPMVSHLPMASMPPFWRRPEKSRGGECEAPKASKQGPAPDRGSFWRNAQVAKTGSTVLAGAAATA